LKQLYGNGVKPTYRATKHKSYWSGGDWSYFAKYWSYIPVE